MLASDRRQARAGLGYIRSFCRLASVAPFAFRAELKEVVEFRTNCSIEVMTASKSAPRGYTCPTANCDEIAFWSTEDGSSNPDHEILTALRGSLGRVPGSLLLALSNPAAPRGELHDAVERAFGRDDPDALVWIADTRSMNPSYDVKTIERAFRRDPVVAMSEFGRDGAVSFRQGRAALLDQEALQGSVVIDRRELAPLPDVAYTAFIDMAEGSRSGDSAALGIAHRDGARAVMDCLRVVEPPFSPGAVITREFVPLLHAYGCKKVTGDRHAAGFVAEVLAAEGITFVPCPQSKSEIYGEFVPLLNTGAVELLDHPTLRTQLLALERRSVRAGRDSIDHPRGGHDDAANAACGALISVTGVGQKKRTTALFSGMTSPELKTPHAALAALAKSTLATLEAQDEIDRRIMAATEDAPMTSPATWFIHRTT